MIRETNYMNMKSICTKLAVMVLPLMFLACGGNGSKSSDVSQKDSIATENSEAYEEDIVHLDMTYYDFDKVKDLTAFFDTIIDKHGTMLEDYYHDGHQNDDLKICIEQIDRYRKGTRKFFPDSLASSCISNLGGQCAQVINHYTGVDLTFSEWFMMCVAYYTPDITCLVQTQTPDHHAGFYNFGCSYNGNPWWSYMFVKRRKGFEVRRVNADYVALTGVYQLEDDKQRKYYLFSNNFSTSFFLQELFYVNGDSAEKVAEMKDYPVSEDHMTQSLYFNKKEMMWYQCADEESTEAKHILNDKKTVQLILDGRNSRFITKE